MGSRDRRVPRWVWAVIAVGAVVVLAAAVGVGVWMGMQLQAQPTAAEPTPMATVKESAPKRTTAPRSLLPQSARKTPTPEPVAPAPPPAPEPQPYIPVCPSGRVTIIYSHVFHEVSVWSGGAIRNDSDTPVQILGLPSAAGFGADGGRLISVAGSFSGPVDYLLPGQSVGFTMTSIPVTAEEFAAVATWRYTGDGTYMSARWLDIPVECGQRAPIELIVD